MIVKEERFFKNKLSMEELLMKKIIISLVAAFMLVISTGLSPASAALADGSYSLKYQVNKPESNSASIANDYFVKPAKVDVKGGTATVQVTLKNSAWITKFQPPGGATVVSEDKAADTRVVQFTVKDLSKPVIIAMKVDVEDINYHHDYSVALVFDTAGNGGASTTTPGATDGSSSTGGSTDGQVANPQTSDSTPYILFVLVAASAILLYRNKFQTKSEA